LKNLARAGVNPLHGGHQWAEKYKHLTFAYDFSSMNDSKVNIF
jgi:hypothetical protein